MYVDGFVVPVKRSRTEDYRKIAKQMADIWMKYGALSVVEAMGDDVPEGKVTSFPMSVKLEPDEVVYFSWITYPDRATRDACNAKVMEEAGQMDDIDPPMNLQRMIFGGFTTVVHEHGGA